MTQLKTTERTPEGAPRAGENGEASYRGVPVSELLADYRLACVSRALDDRQLVLHKQGRTYFQIAGAGHEALLTAIARSLRPGYDWFFPYYRDLTLVLALGVTPTEVLLQAVGSSEDPASAGRQMPAHWGSPELHIVTQSSPTGSQCLPAVGAAEAGRYLQGHPGLDLASAHDEITYVSLGDGATSEGEFWESLNTACRERLPVCYLIADNGYAISVPSSDQAPGPISELVASFPGLTVRRFDGCDYFASRAESAEAIAEVRAGRGPALLHASVTRPYSHSSSDNQARYRAPGEITAEAERDPIAAFERELLAAGILDAARVEAVHAEAHELVAEATRVAMAAPKPDPASAMAHLLALPSIPEPPAAAAEGTETVLFAEAIRRVLAEQMEADERIRVFGEDVADGREALEYDLDGIGGVFGTTLGLQRRFGPDRCFNTPLAEANIVGRAVGQAVRGLHPSPEIQFFDYIWPAMHQIRSEAATTRWRSAGTFSVPMVLRCAIGGWVTGGAIWHSQCGEAIFTHIPGLIVMFPSRARDVVGMMRAAFRCEDPVLFLEHKALFRRRDVADPYPGPDFVVPLGRAATVRPGEDVTIVTWGATVPRCMTAAAALAEEGISAEVLDLRTLAPWDREAVADSVARTSRLLVVHEDVLTGGFGAEVAAWVAEHCFSDLDAPVRRLAALDTWVGYEPGFVEATLPRIDDIATAVRELTGY
ncbi:MAG TPA: dehydrogenase E1 component subunit alpha/beta [Acidimicrobiales bacterium]|nr:dehydrogenase E1 component subunit alpha/beta [Acidimicrobiales bacterium]